MRDMGWMYWTAVQKKTDLEHCFFSSFFLLSPSPFPVSPFGIDRDEIQNMAHGDRRWIIMVSGVFCESKANRGVFFDVGGG